MSQLQVTGEAKIRDIQGPVVANSGVVTALDGAASQYVRGDGTLADFPTSTGGGSSVSYYLNSSVSQGTIGGVAYKELNKEPVIGAGTDITISANGYVANYLTDVNDPDVTIISGGNFNCEFYFSVNNNTGNPNFYAELYKYDGSTFTLLGTSAGVPESINQGTTIAPYYFAIPVATAALSVTDRLAIRIYVNVDGRTVTLHTENGHLCQVVTTLSKGMVSLNNLTDQSQFITTGTTGTDFNIVSSGDTHTFNLPIASATNTGKLSSTDWSTFNNKQAALSFTAPLVNTANTISIPVATSLVDGYLDNADWVNFNTAYNNMIVSAAVTGTTTKTLTLTQQDAGTITASWTDDNTDAVTSVFGRTGAVVATSGDYTTTQVTEGTNLYFTNARAQSAITGGASTITTSNLDTSKALSSNSSGKVVTSITTATELSYLSGVSSNVQTQLDGKAATFTLGSVSSSPTSVLVITGSGAPVNGSLTFTINQSSSSQNGYLSSTDWSTFNNKQGAITLTTTGTSGAATLVGNTLNIPNYTPDLSGYVTIATTQTITGTKTFDGANRQESGILLKNNVITGLAGYTSLGGATNGLAIQLSGSSSIQTLIFQSAAAYSYTLPAASGTIALTSNISYPVTSVFGRTGAIVAVSGDYNTDLVTEGTTNLYFTNARSRSAISLTTTGTSGAATYNSTTGVLNVPQYSTDLSGYVTIATTQTITGNKTFSEATRQESGLLLKNGVLAGATGYASLGGATNGLVVQLSGSANQQTLIFQSGAAYSYTLPATSGTLALTSQIPANPVGGTGTTNYLPKFTGASTIGNSILSESGYTLTQTSANALSVYVIKGTGSTTGLWLYTNGANATLSNQDNGSLTFETNGTTRLTIASTGAATFSSSVGIGGTPTTKFELFGSSGNFQIGSSGAEVFFTRDGNNDILANAGTSAGIRFGGQQQLRFATGTSLTTRLTIDSAGNVGIGTTSPSKLLHLYNTAATDVMLVESTQVFSTIAFKSSTNSSTVTIGIDGAGNASIENKLSSGAMTFVTNGSERMRITSGGNVLIGTTTDESYKLYVNGGSGNAGLFYTTSAANQIKASGTAPAITFTNTITSPTIGGTLGAATSANQFLTGTSAGDVVLINNYSGNKVYVVSSSGGVYLTSGATSWTANSDIRLKNINSHIENAVEKLSTLQTINFCYKDDKSNKQNLGLIAQEVEKIFPELVDKNGDDMLGVRYTELVPVLIKAIQELEARIKQLENK